MWISKKKYDSLCRQNDILSEKSKALDEITYAIHRSKDNVLVVGRDIVVMPYDTWSSFMNNIQESENAIMKIAAERDWYKQKYAELIIDGDTKG